MKVLGTEINPLGMGCWPIGGAMFQGDQPLGYTRSDDAESIRTIHAALDAGITLFDTAAAYGTGHSERLLGQALKDRPEAFVVTKIGLAIDEDSRQLLGPETDPATVRPAVDRCLARLDRDCVDVVLLHQNQLPLATAEAMFDELDRAVAAGKIRAYGWSTDFSDQVAAVSDRAAFAAVEFALNVLVDPPRIQTTVHDAGCVALIRSPLAMGLLTGKYGSDAVIPATDIRGTAAPKTDYFVEGRSNPKLLAQLDAVRELLMTDGRTLVQGALSWIWGKAGTNVPVPGARTVAQIEGLAGALAFGPLPPAVMDEIETLIDRDPPGTPERAR